MKTDVWRLPSMDPPAGLTWLDLGTLLQRSHSRETCPRESGERESTRGGTSIFKNEPEKLFRINKKCKKRT